MACLETCEHLTDEDLHETLRNIQELLTNDGTAVFSVPLETGISGLGKNILRLLLSTEAEDDLNFRIFLRTVFGFVVSRNISKVGDLNYIYSHLGFDQKRFERVLSDYFEILLKRYSPINFLGSFANYSVYYRCVKR